MTDAERCVCCGDIIPEGAQVCSGCTKKKTSAKTAELEAKIATQIIKQYCDERRAQLGECGNCPVKNACLNEVTEWEV